MKVYLVDDDSEEADLFADAASKVNQTVEIVWYADVMEALENLLKEDVEAPVLLFLDLNIPKVSGKDLLRLLRQNKATSQIPVVIYSTSISKKDIEDTAPYNVTSYLQKPEDFTTLCNKLAALLTPFA